MENKSDLETYLLLSSEKKTIAVYNKQNLKNLYINNYNNKNKNQDLNNESVNYFLEKNIFTIEKRFHKFVEKVNLILENNEFFDISISIKRNNYGEAITKDKIVHLLNEAKDECKKSMNDKKIVHMVIENYIIDEKNYSFLPLDLKCNFFSLDIKFICLSKDYFKEIEKILKRYQISINNILQLDYVKQFLSDNQNDLYQMSMQIIDGYNENEVLLVPKVTKNKGFFERFFNFFS